MFLKKLKRSYISVITGAVMMAAMPGVSMALPAEVLSTNSPIADLVAKVGPAVVNIDVENISTDDLRNYLTGYKKQIHFLKLLLTI